MILPFHDDTALQSRRWLVNVSWSSRSHIDGKNIPLFTWLESFVVTGTISRSPQVFPHIDTRPNVNGSRASTASLTSISLINRRRARCVTDQRISTIVSWKITYHSRRTYPRRSASSICVRVSSLLAEAGQDVLCRSPADGRQLLLPPTRRMHSSNEIESLFLTSACPPPHPPRRIFSTHMTSSTIYVFHISCRIFFTTTTRLSDPVSSLPPNIFSSSSVQDSRETQMMQIRTERTHLCMQMRSAKADANAERTSVDALTERAHPWK